MSYVIKNLTRRQFEYRYSNSIVAVNNNDKKLPVKVINSGSATWVGYPLREDGGWLDPIEYRFNDTTLEQPQLGFVQIGYEAPYLFRLEGRGYKQGLNPGLLGYYDLSSREWREDREFAKYSWLHSIYNPEYFQWDEAVRLINSAEYYSVAISPDYALVISPLFDTPMIAYGEGFAGILENGVAKIHPMYDFIAEELMMMDIPLVITDD